MSWKCEKNIDRVKRTPGVYVLYAGNKELKYIGYSKNLFERLLTHEKKWRYVKIKYTNTEEAKRLEYKLIKKIRPLMNVRDNLKRLKSEHRVRLKRETFYTLKMASDFSKKRIADIVEQLVKDSNDPTIKSSIKLSKNIIKEFYEN